MAALLKPGAAFAAREFWHSPLVRAQETACLFAQRMGVRAKLREVAALGPGGDSAHLVRCLEKRRKPLALVGHEPQLSALASLLLGGGDHGPVVVMKKCAVLALERVRGRWTIRGLISPGFPLPGD
jgi:phosphohistidine phosphatase